MSRIPNEEMIQLSKEAEEKIKDGFLEIAGQIEWLALSHDVDIGNLPLHSEHWDAMYKQAKAVEHARHRYMEGEYQLAIDALPEF